MNYLHQFILAYLQHRQIKLQTLICQIHKKSDLSAAFLVLLSNLLGVACNGNSSVCLLSSFSVSSGNTILDLSSHRQESFFYILGGLSGSLQEGNSFFGLRIHFRMLTQTVSEFFGLVVVNDFLFNQIGFVSNKEFVY